MSDVEQELQAIKKLLIVSFLDLPQFGHFSERISFFSGFFMYVVLLPARILVLLVLNVCSLCIILMVFCLQKGHSIVVISGIRIS